MDLVLGMEQPENEQMTMGYLIKVQKVERPTNRSFYLNFPVVLAEALELTKGEEWEWSVEDKNTLVLTRKIKKARRKLRTA
jgi:antitoxin component of MazEF toxin-antitoxin module